MVNEKGFTTRLVLGGLRAALLREGIANGTCQSTEDGPGTEIAMLLTLTPRLPGRMDVSLPVRLVDYHEDAKDWTSLIVVDRLRAALEGPGRGRKVAAEKCEDERGTELATRVTI